jgi:predicted transposase YdaD
MLPLLVEGLFEVLEPKEAMEYIIIFFSYLAKATEHLKKEDYEQALALLPQGGKEVMNTLADQWIGIGEQRCEQRGEQRGERKGREAGKLEGVRSTILDQVLAKFGNIPLGFTRRIDAIDDIGTLKGLSVSLIKAESLEAFEAFVDKAMKPTVH